MGGGGGGGGSDNENRRFKPRKLNEKLNPKNRLMMRN